jgi:transcriptional regulator with XRE-family HTH domain
MPVTIDTVDASVNTAYKPVHEITPSRVYNLPVDAELGLENCVYNTENPGVMTTRPRPAFAQQLDSAMRAAGLSNEVLGRWMSVNRSDVSAWRNGRRRPSLARARKLATRFGWTDADLVSWLGRTPKEEPPPATTAPSRGGYPRKELLVVPTPEHRALYAQLAALELDEIGEIADHIHQAFSRHFSRSEQKDRAEGE